MYLQALESRPVMLEGFLAMEKNGGEESTAWTTSTFGQSASYRGGYSGTNHGPPGRVRVYGWLFYDDPHAGDGSVGTWRGTAWEVHPITRVEVFENGQWKSIE
jgi:hypothetical protein